MMQVIVVLFLFRMLFFTFFVNYKKGQRIVSEFQVTNQIMHPVFECHLTSFLLVDIRAIDIGEREAHC